MFGDEVNPSHVMAAVGLLAGDAHRELPPQVVSTGLPTLLARWRDDDAIAARRRISSCSTHLLAGCGAINLYLAWHDGAGHARARDVHAVVEGGRTRRPALPPARCAPTSPTRPRRRASRSPGCRDGPSQPARWPRSRATASRVGGEVVPVIEGTRAPVTARRLLRPRPHADGRLERLPLRARDVQGRATCRAARSRATRSTDPIPPAGRHRCGRQRAAGPRARGHQGAARGGSGAV